MMGSAFAAENLRAFNRELLQETTGGAYVPLGTGTPSYYYPPTTGGIYSPPIYGAPDAPSGTPPAPAAPGNGTGNGTDGSRGVNPASAASGLQMGTFPLFFTMSLAILGFFFTRH